MENDSRPNHRVGFHTIEMLLKLSPENIKQIFVPAIGTMQEFKN